MKLVIMLKCIQNCNQKNIYMFVWMPMFLLNTPCFTTEVGFHLIEMIHRLSVSWDGYKQHDAFSTSSWAGINQVIWWHPSGTESLLLYSLSPVWAASCQRFWIIHSTHVDFPADSKICQTFSPSLAPSFLPSPFLMEKLLKCETL